ncbi:hypothetical protein GP486_001492 [Trichoglossum hirsutum]|uniref:MHYT domain-containing protein n=1 Tax=Trichoglossum hirsutum TaxID=265104 RepID=A0A9P8RSJ8_9PEZI|nr:hypothetical protein GP486_001492 [Trichoglossum hirsutum]
MTVSTPDYDYLVGKTLPQSYNIGFVILSYAVSYVGSLTTLELLQRRTSRRGAYNWYLLAGSSLSMGGIGIWSMHYVANRAIILLNDTVSQISYSAGYTTLSFFVPIFVLLAAFSILGTNETISKRRLGLSGALAGLAICGMHYLGQAGISNYVSVYDVRHVVGAAIIAVAASITALAVFFALRAAWTNSWWKRAICAIVLAGAVSGMHWTAALGTQYRFRQITAGSEQNLTAKQTVTMVIIFSIAACALLLGLAMLAQRRRLEQADRAQQVVLASATFDPKGRLMVTTEGLMPSQKITTSYLEQSLEDVFCSSHPVFLWIYRVTRNWQGIVDLVPSMKSHIRTITTKRDSQTGNQTNLQSYNPAPGRAAEAYAFIFRELFCVSAVTLAGQVGRPLEKLGVLYDEILNTGVTKKSDRLIPKPDSVTKDAESGTSEPYTPYGRGQLLFVVRQLDAAEAADSQALGYRFTEPGNVIDILAKSMQVGREDLQTHIEDMRTSCTHEYILEPGVHLACFAIRACVRGGFDVLVRKDAKNLLPTTQLRASQLSQVGLDVIQTLEGLSVRDCLIRLRNKPTCSGDEEHTFVTQFYDALVALAEMIDEPLTEEAALLTTPILAPCRGRGPQSVPGQATLIAFRTIVPIQSQAPCDQLQFSPLSLFNTQQQVYSNSTSHDTFTHAIHREFADNLSSKNGPGVTQAGKQSSHPSPNPKRWTKILGTDQGSKSDRRDIESQSFGGILVSQSVIVTEVELDPAVEMETLGTTGQAMKEEEDTTFVNGLVAACVTD